MRGMRIFARLIIAVPLLQIASTQGQPAKPAGATTAEAMLPSKLTNRDVLQMQAAGLSGDVITEKIKTSTCDFDTAPASLSQLKSVGLPDAVILAMIRRESNAATAITLPPIHPATATNSAPMSGEVPKGYVLSYVRSDRKWKLGLRSEPYDKISEYSESQLAAALDQRGLHRLPIADGGCCQVTIELLEVTSHPAMMKKPGVDVAATATLTDGKNRLVYSKGYRGESRTVMNTWGHLINHAVEAMVKNIMSDDMFVKALVTGKP